MTYEDKDTAPRTKYAVLQDIEQAIRDYRQDEYELLHSDGHHDFLHRPNKTRTQELLDLRAECFKHVKDLAQEL